jgi:hypothetical protein
MMDGLVGLLPGGYWDPAGALHREFELAVLTGRDEELLAEAGRQESASLVSAVLSRCVGRLGDMSPVPLEVTRQLLVADRRYLLLRLRQLTFGDQVHASLVCPWPDCGERVSISLSLGSVPVKVPPDRAPAYEMVLSEVAAPAGPAASREIGFRLPNGADQEELSPWLARNEAMALTLLLARCIQRIGAVAPPGDEQLRALSPLARAEIEARMEELAPQVEQTIEVGCAECGQRFQAPFDVQRLFFGELRTDSDLLYREVHYLAYHYHWGEGEILAMTRAKRQRYIDVLGDEIARLDSGR